MRRRGLLLLLTALGACKDTPAPPAPAEAEKPPEEAAKPKVADAGAQAVKRAAPTPLVDPALKEGSFAVWEVQAATLPAGTRATFVATTATYSA